MKMVIIRRFLSIISTITLLTAFNQLPAATTSIKKSREGVWSIATGLGMNWKPKNEAVDNRWIGFLGTIGINWQKPFANRCTFSVGLLWGLFLPDMFMASKPTLFKINMFDLNINIPYDLALFLPMTSLQFGYFFNRAMAFIRWSNLFSCFRMQLKLFPLLKTLC